MQRKLLDVHEMFEWDKNSELRKVNMKMKEELSRMQKRSFSCARNLTLNFNIYGTYDKIIRT